jgi:hypothetical protein
VHQVGPKDAESQNFSFTVLHTVSSNNHRQRRVTIFFRFKVKPIFSIFHNGRASITKVGEKGRVSVPGANLQLASYWYIRESKSADFFRGLRLAPNAPKVQKIFQEFPVEKISSFSGASEYIQ